MTTQETAAGAHRHAMAIVGLIEHRRFEVRSLALAGTMARDEAQVYLNTMDDLIEPCMSMMVDDDGDVILGCEWPVGSRIRSSLMQDYLVELIMAEYDPDDGHVLSFESDHVATFKTVADAQTYARAHFFDEGVYDINIYEYWGEIRCDDWTPDNDHTVPDLGERIDWDEPNRARRRFS
jgi:hypothetical protein